MVKKLGQFTKLGRFSFLNCPNFVTISFKVWKMEIFFFYIPSNPPPIVVRNSLTNKFFQKKVDDSVYFQQQKMQNWREEKGPGTLLFSSVLHNCFFLLLKIYRIVKFALQWSFVATLWINEVRGTCKMNIEMALKKRIVFL